MLLLIASILLTTTFAWQAKMDWDRQRKFLSIFEMILAIFYLASGICAICYFTLQVIS